MDNDSEQKDAVIKHSQKKDANDNETCKEDLGLQFQKTLKLDT